MIIHALEFGTVFVAGGFVGAIAATGFIVKKVGEELGIEPVKLFKR